MHHGCRPTPRLGGAGTGPVTRPTVAARRRREVGGDLTSHLSDTRIACNTIIKIGCAPVVLPKLGDEVHSMLRSIACGRAHPTGEADKIIAEPASGANTSLGSQARAGTAAEAERAAARRNPDHRRQARTIGVRRQGPATTVRSPARMARDPRNWGRGGKGEESTSVRHANCGRRRATGRRRARQHCLRSPPFVAARRARGRPAVLARQHCLRSPPFVAAVPQRTGRALAATAAMRKGGGGRAQAKRVPIQAPLGTDRHLASRQAAGPHRQDERRPSRPVDRGTFAFDMPFGMAEARGTVNDIHVAGISVRRHAARRVNRQQGLLDAEGRFAPGGPTPSPLSPDPYAAARVIERRRPVDELAAAGALSGPMQKRGAETGAARPAALLAEEINSCKEKTDSAPIHKLGRAAARRHGLFGCTGSYQTFVRQRRRRN